jgi:predicted metal-dependent phosphoesterase TrpH
MKIDLHVHTAERSPCGRAGEEAQIQAAIGAGLDALVFTDHRVLAPPERLKQLNDKYEGIWIIGGIEVTVDQEDVIVLGLHDPKLEKAGWSYPDLRQYVADRGGFIAVAHPFRYHEELLLDVESVPPDGIECWSCSTPVEAEETIREISHELGIPVLSNSDAHRTELLGRWYNILLRDPADETELVEMLKAGEFECYAEEGGANVKE